MALRSAQAYWDPEKKKLIEIVNNDPEKLDHETLVLLVKELDRRFIQLWDKVVFENKHDLVDYSKLQK